jgi:hypothetical protein
MNELSSAWNMYVFRDGRRFVCGRALLDGLASAVQAVAASPDSRKPLLNALLRAGELECALTDIESPHAVHLSHITDLLAARLVGLETPSARPPSELEQILGKVEVPPELKISPPEGFAYYALHPLDYADLADRLCIPSGFAAVIGVRSIGTTLSAVVTAALRRRGVRADRITVRPAGHPYDRRTQFTPEQLQWIARHRSHSAEFIATDEGPGMSGSSFLSVGDALLGAGVERSRILFLCSREPDPGDLRAPDAAERWPAFRSLHASPNRHLPVGAKLYIGAGEWRRNVFALETHWPASWIHMERLKFLTADRKLLYKFEGFGRFGAEVHERARLLGEAGFSPAPHDYIEGFGCYPLLEAHPLMAGAAWSEILERMADYCAFRSFEFHASGDLPARELEEMVRFNLQEEFGAEPQVDTSVFYTDRPIIADGRMLPHEWLRANNGRLYKVDGTTHGDDHFFPGPTDIAWDLAGAIIEWDLEPEAANYLVERYRRATGDDPRARLPAFLLAYGVFRMAYCKMAAAALRGTAEQARLHRAYQRYREMVEMHFERELAA